jgi:hypothetical protein
MYANKKRRGKKKIGELEQRERAQEVEKEIIQEETK